MTAEYLPSDHIIVNETPRYEAVYHNLEQIG